MPGPLESTVEDYFVARVEALGGVAEKTRAIGSRGYFDRVAVIPARTIADLPEAPPSIVALILAAGPLPARVIFAELKRPKGGRLSVHQIQRIQRYRAIGAEVVVLSTKAHVDELLG